MSLSLIGRNPYRLLLPNTGGLTLQFIPLQTGLRPKTQTISINYAKGINAYRTGFDVNKFNFNPQGLFPSRGRTPAPLR